MVFVNFEKAFDVIDCEMLRKIVRHYGVPAKIVRMIQVLCDGFQAWVLLEGRMTEPFEMKTGVRRGCLLSPLCFLSSLDWVNRQAYGEHKTGIRFIMCKKLEDLDLDYSAKGLPMSDKFESHHFEASKVGLKVNASKTKETRIGSPGNKALERVEAFTYLAR